MTQQRCSHVMLQPREYLADVMGKILDPHKS